jgi:hypothetical protein
MAKARKKKLVMRFDPGPPPERLERVRRVVYLEGGETIQELIDKVPEHLRNEAHFENDYGEVELVWYGPEGDEDFENRLKWHAKARKDYDKWYAANRAELEEHERKQLQDEIDKLESQKKTFEKSLETTKRKLEELNRKGKKP